MGAGTNTWATSVDGITWVAKGKFFTNSGNGITYNSNLNTIVLVGTTSTYPLAYTYNNFATTFNVNGIFTVSAFGVGTWYNKTTTTTTTGVITTTSTTTSTTLPPTTTPTPTQIVQTVLVNTVLTGTNQVPSNNTVSVSGNLTVEGTLIVTGNLHLTNNSNTIVNGSLVAEGNTTYTEGATLIVNNLVINTGATLTIVINTPIAPNKRTQSLRSSTTITVAQYTNYSGQYNIQTRVLNSPQDAGYCTSATPNYGSSSLTVTISVQTCPTAILVVSSSSGTNSLRTQ